MNSRWESHKQKVAWQQATAANAVKLEELVEIGGFIPMEVMLRILEDFILSSTFFV